MSVVGSGIHVFYNLWQKIDFFFKSGLEVR